MLYHYKRVIGGKVNNKNAFIKYSHGFSDYCTQLYVAGNLIIIYARRNTNYHGKKLLVEQLTFVLFVNVIDINGSKNC